jgi:hypothetical protein
VRDASPDHACTSSAGRAACGTSGAVGAATIALE